MIQVFRAVNEQDVNTAFGIREQVFVLEQQVPRAQPVWKLFTTGSVGSQALMGLPLLHRLSQRAGVAVAMGNAAPQIQAHADRVTADHNEDGIALALQRWVLPS